MSRILRNSPRRLSCGRAVAMFGLVVLPVTGAAVVAGPAQALGGAAFRASATPAASATTVAAEPAVDDATAIAAFVDAGYSYQDAEVLALAWGVTGDADHDKVAAAKVLAGGFLARGIALTDSPYAWPVPDYPYTPAELADLLFANGYTTEDAAVLAEQWGLPVGEAKSRAMTEIKTVGVIPFVDSSVFESDPYADAFFAAGYSYEDAVVLADRWGLGEDSYTAKVKAGYELKAGVALADSVFGDPTADDGYSRAGLRQVFFDYGYTAEDARVLADNWGVSVKKAKAMAGSELKTVGVLPFVDAGVVTAG